VGPHGAGVNVEIAVFTQAGAQTESVLLVYGTVILHQEQYEAQVLQLVAFPHAVLHEAEEVIDSGEKAHVSLIDLQTLSPAHH